MARSILSGGAIWRVLTGVNLCLLVLFPVSWFAPLMRAGLLPLFGLSEISVVSGIVSLWEDAPLLSVLVAVFALAAPMVKTVALTLVHLSRAPARILPVTALLGKLAMADIFLIAIYITLSKGIGVGRVETAWGLWLFTGCIVVSLAVSILTASVVARARA